MVLWCPRELLLFLVCVLQPLFTKKSICEHVACRQQLTLPLPRILHLCFGSVHTNSGICRKYEFLRVGWVGSHLMLAVLFVVITCLQLFGQLKSQTVDVWTSWDVIGKMRRIVEYLF